MEEIKLEIKNDDSGSFRIFEKGEQYGEMAIRIQDDELTVYHTEVISKAEGQGYGKKLLAKMVSYARKNDLRVISYCPFVSGQFKKDPSAYRDIWFH
jgi:predicted GNAT family acetyltransferase